MQNSTDKPLKILYLSPKPPLPRIDGGTVAQFALCKNIVDAKNELKIVTFSTSKHPFVENEYGGKYLAENIRINTEIKSDDAFKNLFSKSSYFLDRFKSDTRIFILKELLKTEKFDILFIDHLYAGADIDMLKTLVEIPIIIRPHNIEFQIWEEKAKNCKNTLKKKYLELQAKRLKKEELNILSKADLILPMSWADKKIITDIFPTKKMAYFPVAMEELKALNNQYFDVNKAYFIGAFDWEPNKNGLMKFIDLNWEKTIKKYPEFKLFVGGRKMPDEIKNISIKNIKFEGEIGSVANFIEDKSVFIAPIDEGGGVKIKVLEAMMNKKLVIASPQAVSGIELIAGKHYLDMGSDFSNFLSVLDQINSHTNLAKEIVQNAYQFAQENFSSHMLSQKLNNIFQLLMNDEKK
jgi:polysaccharide biosynthesis protein PslH